MKSNGKYLGLLGLSLLSCALVQCSQPLSSSSNAPSNTPSNAPSNTEPAPANGVGSPENNVISRGIEAESAVDFLMVVDPAQTKISDNDIPYYCAYWGDREDETLSALMIDEKPVQKELLLSSLKAIEIQNLEAYNLQFSQPSASQASYEQIRDADVTRNADSAHRLMIHVAIGIHSANEEQSNLIALRAEDRAVFAQAIADNNTFLSYFSPSEDEQISSQAFDEQLANLQFVLNEYTNEDNISLAEELANIAYEPDTYEPNASQQSESGNTTLEDTTLALAPLTEDSVAWPWQDGASNSCDSVYPNPELNGDA